MTGVYVTVAVVAAFALLIWRLVSQSKKLGKLDANRRQNENSLEVIDDANEVEIHIDGMQRDDVDRVLQGPRSD